jgi:hypothetical protein
VRLHSHGDRSTWWVRGKLVTCSSAAVEPRASFPGIDKWILCGDILGRGGKGFFPAGVGCWDAG